MDKILEKAINEIGEKEIPGPDHNARIIQYAKEAGFDWVNDDETPWCSIFMNWVAGKAGYKGSKAANARSWLLVGTPADASPEPGNVVVFWRDNPNSWKGHVGVFLGLSKDSKKVFCLGGNQGNMVSISAYPVDTVLGYRRLESSIQIDVPDRILQDGDTGDDVKALQQALKSVGIECGASDGIFGPRTKGAVETLQSMKPGLNISGVFDSNTRNYLLEIIIN